MMAFELNSTIAAVTSVVTKGTTPTTLGRSFTSSGIGFIKAECISDDGTFVKAKQVFIDEETDLLLRRSRLKRDDVLFSIAGVIGRTALVRESILPANTNQAVAILRPKRDVIDPRFLYYTLRSKSFQDHSLGHVVQTAQANVSLGVLSAAPIWLPSLVTQRRIAGILSAYDDLMENSQRRIRVLETMVRALYREWFVHFRFPGHEKLPRVASAFGDIPKGWDVKAVGAIAETFRGRSYRSVDLADDGGVPFLNLKCLDRDGGFRRTGLKRYVGEYKDRHVARKGDIVLAVTDMTQERRIVARAALVPTLDTDFAICSMDLIRIEPKPPVPKSYLYSFLRYSSFADEVKQHANGANVLHLSPERVTAFQYPVPPADLMARFASFVAPTLEQIDALENKVDNLRQTRDLLLPRLLSGQIEVQTD